MSDWTDMDALIRSVGRRAPADGHPSSTIGDDDDRFARHAKELGIAPDLVDVARASIQDAGELSGAALHSALERTIADHPSLRVAEPRVPGAGGLFGGMGRGAGGETERDEGQLVDAQIRAAAGRGPMPSVVATNGIKI